MSEDAEKLLTVAKIAEECDRYVDMKQAMKQLIELKNGKGVSCEERNLLSMAYKNIVGGHRSSWRVLTGYASQVKQDQVMEEKINTYRKIVVHELKDCCNEVLTLIDRYLLNSKNTTDERSSSNDDDDHVLPQEDYDDSICAKVFFTKMKGDYYRYQTEVIPEEDESRTSVISNAKDAYEESTLLADNLDCMNPLRLGLALNYSVFHYEILNQTDKACEIAKTAYDNAMEELDSLKAETTKESALILQLLRDNLTLWQDVCADVPSRE